MSVKAITEALHEHMYEKLNDSSETEEEKKNRYLNKRKQKAIKNKWINRPNSKKWTVTDAEPRTGRDNTNIRPEGRNVQNARSLAITLNVAKQTSK